MSERAFAWRSLTLAGRAAAVLGGLLAAAIGSPAEAQILGTACASPSATVAASATTLHVNGTVYLTRYGSAPATCNRTVNGLLALTSAAKMCVCDGTS